MENYACEDGVNLPLTFICSIAAGDIKLREHAAVAWLPRNQLFTLDWAEADLPVVDAYCRLFLKTEP